MQIPLSDWPLDLSREIATIDAASVSATLGTRLAFERDHDDLDGYSAAVFSIEGAAFALLRYDNIPGGDFTLIAMSGDARDRDLLEAFLAWSGLSMSAVTWRRPPEAN